MNDFKLRVLKHVAAELREKGRNSLHPELYVKLRNGKHRILPIPPELMATQESKDKALEILQYMNKTLNTYCCCFVAECRIGAGDKDKLEKCLTEEEMRIFNAQDSSLMTEELYEKIKSCSEHVDGVFFNFQHFMDDDHTEFMGFEVDENGLMKPYKTGDEESLMGAATKGISGRFSNLYA